MAKKKEMVKKPAEFESGVSATVIGYKDNAEKERASKVFREQVTIADLEALPTLLKKKYKDTRIFQENFITIIKPSKMVPVIAPKKSAAKKPLKIEAKK